MFFGLVTMKEIRTDFDKAMEKRGYVRAKVICERWGITTNQLQKAFQKGFVCDRFKVNGVWYISTLTMCPLRKDEGDDAETKSVVNKAVLDLLEEE